MAAISLIYILTTALGVEILTSSRLYGMFSNRKGLQTKPVYAAVEDRTEVSESAEAALRDTLTANTAYSQPNAVQEQQTEEEETGYH